MIAAVWTVWTISRTATERRRLRHGNAPARRPRSRGSAQDQRTGRATIRSLAGRYRQAARLAAGFDLTERQTATARLLLAGRSTADIAADLGIRLNTARRHCEAVLEKTGAGQRHTLAAPTIEPPQSGVQKNVERV
ncbi:LuxR C-terminal-related transcriptional regulator [uncultured Rhodospira sp.]|uniref:helix-turn-helix transcriptional regulator n=1 Tax=uncultured Rhodospira sp. TaxID=1936189 RepID=UPI003458122A